MNVWRRWPPSKNRMVYLVRAEIQAMKKFLKTLAVMWSWFPSSIIMVCQLRFRWFLPTQKLRLHDLCVKDSPSYRRVDWVLLSLFLLLSNSISSSLHFVLLAVAVGAWPSPILPTSVRHPPVRWRTSPAQHPPHSPRPLATHNRQLLRCTGTSLDQTISTSLRQHLTTTLEPRSPERRTSQRRDTTDFDFDINELDLVRFRHPAVAKCQVNEWPVTNSYLCG